jgi:hypothetical protein
VVVLPGLPAKGDVSDWVQQGGTREQLEALADAAMAWSPPVVRGREASATATESLIISDPRYTTEDSTHRVTFGDGIRLEVIRPQKDRLGRFWGEVAAFLANGHLANRARIDLLNQRERDIFHQVAASVDDHVDWHARLLYTVERVRNALQTPEWDTDAAPGDAAEPWPVLDDAALHGLAGDIVGAIAPYTEADPVATLLNLLVGVGNAANATAYATVQHDRHPARLFVVQVGLSSKAAKGRAGAPHGSCCLAWMSPGRRSASRAD